MKKYATLILVILALGLCFSLVNAEHGEWADCGCPEGAGVFYSYPTYYKSTGEETHILLEKQLIYCASCGKQIGRGSDVNLSWHEPHVFSGYECIYCGHWSLGTATAYDDAPYTGLRSASVGSIVTFGSYEQDGMYNNGAEPIEWIVLDRRGDRVLLLSRYGLDAQPYHQTSTAVNWSNSYIRQWLHSDFYNEAFTTDEQEMIATTQNATPVNSNNAGSPGPNTNDKVFLLSSTEATKYLPSPESRMVKATSYALMRGAGTNYSQNSFWWVRSYADGSRRKVLMVNSQGNVYASYMNDYEAVVRPAIWIEVE